MPNNVSLQLWWSRETRGKTNGGVKGEEKHQSGEHDCEQKYSLDGGGDDDDDGGGGDYGGGGNDDDDDDDDDLPGEHDCEQKCSSDGGDDHSDCEHKCLL